MEKKDKKNDTNNIGEQSTCKENSETENLGQQQAAEVKTEEIKTEEVKVEEVKTEEVKEEVKEKEVRRKKNHIPIFVCCTFIALLFILYGSIAIYYQSHFLPNTTVNEFECSNLTAAEVSVLLDNQIQQYQIEISGRLTEDGEKGVLGEIGAQDIDLELVDTLSAVEDLLAQQNVLLWAEVLANKHYSYSLQQGVNFNEELLANCVEKMNAFHNMIPPRDAYISEYSEDEGEYEIVPETAGTQLDKELVTEAVKNAILTHETNVDLEEQGCYITASVTAEDEVLRNNVDTANKWLRTEITYDWNGQEILVDKEIINEWISFDKNKPQMNEEAVADFVSERAKNADTYGKKRTFTTTLGVELVLPSGAYGWKTDVEGETQELIQLIYQGSVLEKEPLYLSTGRQKGSNDIGSSYVEADLSNQHLYLYYQGNIVLETDFVSGNPNKSGCRTPAGVFGLTYKTTNAVLRGDDYETPVSYWMPFHGNFGMHDATWRREFGGDIYLTRGSHGCINLPLDKAEAIYGYVSTGFPVISYYY